MVTERQTARATAKIAPLNVVAFGALVVVVMHASTRLGRVICRNLGHCVDPFYMRVDRIFLVGISLRENEMVVRLLIAGVEIIEKLIKVMEIIEIRIR